MMVCSTSDISVGNEKRNIPVQGHPYIQQLAFIIWQDVCAAGEQQWLANLQHIANGGQED